MSPWLWAACALAAPVAPIAEVDHPTYRDAAGATLTWGEVRDLAEGSDALRQVRRRRLGRTVLRATFAAATAVEVWGTYQLAQRPDDTLAYPLGAQAALTGLCGVLLWTSLPSDRMEDRALVVDAVNAKLRGRF